MSSGLQVVDNLRLFDAAQPGQSFQLNYYFLAADEICPIGGRQLAALIQDRQFHLSLKGNAAEREFDGQCLLIHRLQKSTSQLPVYLHRRADDGIRSWISVCLVVHLHLCNLRNLRIKLVWATSFARRPVGARPSSRPLPAAGLQAQCLDPPAACAPPGCS